MATIETQEQEIRRLEREREQFIEETITELKAKQDFAFEAINTICQSGPIMVIPLIFFLILSRVWNKKWVYWILIAIIIVMGAAVTALVFFAIGFLAVNNQLMNYYDKL